MELQHIGVREESSWLQGQSQYIEQIRNEPKDSYKDISHPTTFHEILNDNLPESGNTTSRIADEAFLVAGAGTHTTAWALTVATYHIPSQPSML